MLSNLAVSTHSGGISVAIEDREKSPSVANWGCYVLARFGLVLASPQYRTLRGFRRSYESAWASPVVPNRVRRWWSHWRTRSRQRLVDWWPTVGTFWWRWHGFNGRRWPTIHQNSPLSRFSTSRS